MFDKMIVSDVSGSGSEGRSRYFIVSTAVVGILFLSAVVFSIYAADIGLGDEEFELSTMLAPVMPDEPDVAEPEEQPRQPDSRQNTLPSRAQNMLRPDESPNAVPDAVSTTQNPYLSRPRRPFIVSQFDSNGSGTPGETGSRTGSPNGTSSAGAPPDTEPVVEKVPPPPPAISKPRVPPIVSKGVINGTAKYLPHPPYPRSAQMVGAQGAVSVQVTIDEAGKVISAKAVSGHPLLKPAAEKAAWDAKFTPTLLSEVPVKVTGVIVYNFKKN